MSGACKACGETDDRLVSGGFCVDRISCHWRVALTRALTAQAWAVACAMMLCAKPKHGYQAAVVAALPAPADLAREILGGG